MHIGFDMDGVLLDVETYMAQKGAAYLNKPVVNPAGEDIAAMFDVPQEQEDAFWRDHMLDYATTPPARDGISALIRGLRQAGAKIFIVTNRGRDLSFCEMTQSQMQAHVATWLQKQGIEYDDLCFANGDKKGCCVRYDIDLFVEDSPEIIDELMVQNSTGGQFVHPSHILCFDASYNRQVKGDYITRVLSARDIEEFCRRFIKNL